jgi:undecaprenyl-diphosphatase
MWATAITGIIGEGLIELIEHTLFSGQPKAQIEDLFGRLDLVAPALAAAGILILIAGLRRTRAEDAADRAPSSLTGSITRRSSGNVTMGHAGWMGLLQGLALPFRGFSRSGVTISIGMLTGATRERAERFSFAMAVAITPLAIGREALRVVHAKKDAAAAGIPLDLHATAMMSLLGMVCAFLAGLVALKWLSSWLESGRWYLFGIYCLAASATVFWLHTRGY